MNKEETQPTVYGQPLGILEPNVQGRMTARQQRRGEVPSRTKQCEDESEWNPPPTLF